MKNIEKSNKGALILNSAIWLIPILIFKDDLNFKNSETFKHSVTGLKKHSFENGKVTAAKIGGVWHHSGFPTPLRNRCS